MKNLIRRISPIRRATPTKNPTGTRWSEHKPDLKEDFNSSCGYCGSSDSFRHTYYEVDHYIPKSLFIATGNIGLCDYHNLTYSCKFCNGIKSNKWPSKNEFIQNDGYIGFIDACDPDYENHLQREPSGRISYKTDLGKWIVEVGFKFDERHLELATIWNLGELKIAIEEIDTEMSRHPPDSPHLGELKEIHYNSLVQYFFNQTELMKFYDA